MHENLLLGYWVALYLIVASLVFISSVFAIVFIIRLLRHARRGPDKRSAKARHGDAKIIGGIKKDGATPVMTVISPQNVHGQNTGIGASEPGVSTDPVVISYARLATDPTGATTHQAGIALDPPGISYAKLAADPKRLTPYPTANQYYTGTGSEPIGITYTRLPTDLTGVTPYSTEVTHVTLASDPAEVIIYPIAAENTSGIAHARLATDPMAKEHNVRVGFDTNTGFVVL